ncbi:MAG: hypothetical protein M3177_04635, partial [Pseudomonadota bacterium]|nr:hypothetical protein [Pseudomonadota bacterium]
KEVDDQSTNDPRELHYNFNGMRLGDVSNNGTSDVDYVTSINRHTATPGTGPFDGGATTGTVFADFDQSYDPVNGLSYEGAAGRYIVREGEHSGTTGALCARASTLARRELSKLAPRAPSSGHDDLSFLFSAARLEGMVRLEGKVRG